jgi:two-component system KDP operon response regulator KdpE
MLSAVNRADNRVAIIDDDPDSGEILAVMLELDGYEIELFTSGADFLAVFPSRRFALILMDLSMPEMDGFELLTIVRRTEPALPIFAVTARAFEKDQKLAGDAGFSEFITKPILDFDAVRKLVSKHLPSGRPVKMGT